MAGAPNFQLPPLPAAVAALPNWVAQQTTTLVLKEKVMSWSGDDFHIKTIDGLPIFRVMGKVMSMSGRKELSDAQGNHLFTIRKELFSIPSSYYAESPSGERFLNVDGKWSFGSSKSDISFVDCHTGQKVVLKIKGNFFDTNADITLNDMVVATIDRKLWSGKDIFANKQTYFLTVAPGMDMATAVAACICLDERRNEQR